MADEKRSRWAFLKVDPKDLVVETFSVVLGITLAVSVGRLIDNRQSHNRMMDALGEIRQEIAADDAKMRASHALHVRVREAFLTSLKASHNEQISFDTFARTFGDTAPKGFQPFAGSTTAWDLARSSSVLADVPYAVRAGLQERYADLISLREDNASLQTRIEPSPSSARPNFYFSMEAAALILGDIVAAEERLVDEDAAALDQLKREGVK